MVRSDTNTNDAQTVALNALTFLLNNQLSAERFLGVTGLTPDDLRGRLAEPSVLAATLAYLEAHEPDLIACAAALDIAPARLVAARAVLDQAT